MIRTIHSAVIGLLFLSACASVPEIQEVAAPAVQPATQVPPPAQKPVAQARRPILDDPWELKLVQNSEVQRWIEYFTVQDRDRFSEYLNRAAVYRPLVESIIKQSSLPQEFLYLALIESGYQYNARSHASAVGVWQFIEETGKRYGLRVKPDLDERLDVVRSTYAATRYLKDLHNVFHSWDLAIAAYNSGERRVLSAILSGKSRDFWELARDGRLPQETANYVPKFMAACLIGRNPEKFGFKIDRSARYPEVEAVAVPAPVSLEAIARAADAPLDVMKFINPQLHTGHTPSDLNTYDVWVPKKQVLRLKGQFQVLATVRIPQRAIAQVKNPVKPQNKLQSKSQQRTLVLAASNESTRTQQSKNAVHVVRTGETLYSIAKRYSTTVDQLRGLNGIESTILFTGKRLKVPSSRGAVSENRSLAGAPGAG